MKGFPSEAALDVAFSSVSSMQRLSRRSGSLSYHYLVFSRHPQRRTTSASRSLQNFVLKSSMHASRLNCLGWRQPIVVGATTPADKSIGNQIQNQTPFPSTQGEMALNFSLCSGPEEIDHAVSSGRYANKVQHPCLQVVQLYFHI